MLSIRSRQCALIGISRSAWYGTGKTESPLNLALMKLIDAQFLETPFYGSRQMARCLRNQGYCVGRKRFGRLMAAMGLRTVYQRPRTTVPHPEHPYLLRDLVIERPNQVWCADITYIPMRCGVRHRPRTGGGSCLIHSTLSRSWTRQRAGCRPGNCPARWTPSSASRRWKTPFGCMSGPRSSTRIRAVSSSAHASRSPC
ncbi:IS3 family transposase [Rhodovulum sulfidophilum]|nr:IS3 family transposase [Rhodovulum sulfidophilum]